MDYRLLLVTFATIFIAELGDKTQFVALAAGAGAKSIAPVLIGVVLGLSAAGVVGVLVGKSLGAILSPHILKWMSGLLFIAIGIVTLVKK